MFWDSVIMLRYSKGFICLGSLVEVLLLFASGDSERNEYDRRLYWDSLDADSQI
jgi:hypothetical protein